MVADKTDLWDVAISFLADALGIAQEIRDHLSPSLKVFVYTHEQSAVAASQDGVEPSLSSALAATSRNPRTLRDRASSEPFVVSELQDGSRGDAHRFPEAARILRATSHTVRSRRPAAPPACASI